MALCHQKKATNWDDIDPDLRRHMMSLSHNDLTDDV